MIMQWNQMKYIFIYTYILDEYLYNFLFYVLNSFNNYEMRRYFAFKYLDIFSIYLLKTY